MTVVVVDRKKMEKRHVELIAKSHVVRKMQILQLIAMITHMLIVHTHTHMMKAMKVTIIVKNHMRDMITQMDMITVIKN